MSLKTLACLLLALATLACAPLRASPLVQLDLIDRDTGALLQGHHHRGDTWVAGTPGHRYGVRLANRSGERVLVVLSVDGVNAVSGQTAAPTQAGYVLEPWATAEIDGWRKSLQDVAQFVFTDLGDSYAARTGRPRNVGVVGIAVFTEARSAWNPSPPPAVAKGRAGESRSMAPQSPAGDSHAGNAASVMQQSIGTGHGQRQWSPVGQTHFLRASRRPAQVTEVRYDDARQLALRGIVPQPPVASGWPNRPRAFPQGFVPDP